MMGGIWFFRWYSVRCMVTLGLGEHGLTAIHHCAISFDSSRLPSTGDRETTMAIIKGTRNNDVLVAADGDTVNAGAGDDDVTAGNNCIINLGDGNDRLVAGAHAVVTGGIGNDNVTVGDNSSV